MTNYAALKTAATTIKNEVEDGANTADRVGSAILNLVESANTDIAELLDSADGALYGEDGTATFDEF